LTRYEREKTFLFGARGTAKKKKRGDFSLKTRRKELGVRNYRMTRGGGGSGGVERMEKEEGEMRKRECP